MKKRPRISIIAAIGENRELGKKNELIWRVSDDLKRVKVLTMGHPLIMGWNTYQSIGRPLPGRTNIVISRTPSTPDGYLVVSSLEEALWEAEKVEREEIFIFGGARIYAEALPHTDRLYLTYINATDPDADVFFPDYTDFTTIIAEESHTEQTPSFTWRTLERNT